MSSIADLVTVLGRIDTDNRRVEELMIQDADTQYSATHPKLTRWDYEILISGLLSNVFLFESDAQGFVDWVIPQMTGEILEELRRYPEGFQDKYGDLYLEAEKCQR